MHLEAQMRRHREAATSRLFRWLSVLFPFSLVGSVLGQGMLPPAPGFGGAPSVPQMGVPNDIGSRMNQQINNQINGQPANGTQPNGQANGQLPNGPSNGPGTPAIASPGSSAPSAGGEGNGEVQTPPASMAAPLESLMNWGIVHVHVGASYQFLYDSEVHTQPGSSTSTRTHTFTVPITAQIGPHVTLNYTPSYRIFSQKDFNNTLDHFASLSGGIGYGDWRFGVFQTFSRSDEPLIETGSQTSQDDYNTGVNATYLATDRLSFTTSAGMDLNYINSGNQTNLFTNGGTNTPAIVAPNSKSYDGSEWMNYQINEKLGTGVGITFSYSDQQGGFRSTSEQYQGSVTWHPGEKLSLSLVGGLEDQQFLNTGAPDNVTPIFSASAHYQALEHTSFSIFANRTVSASLFEQQITEVTSVGVGFQQRLLGTLQFSAGFNYSVNDFKTTEETLAVDSGGNMFIKPLSIARSDDLYNYTAGLNLPFLKRGNASVFYSYNKDVSSQAGFGYSSSQVGVTLSWTY